MGSVGFVYPTSLNVGKAERKHSWSMQSDIVTFRSQARWCGRFRLEEDDDDEDGSIGKKGGGNPRYIVRSLGGNLMDKSASAEDRVEVDVYGWWLGRSWSWSWSWSPRSRVKGNRGRPMQSERMIELEEGWPVRGSKVSSGTKFCLCSFAAAIGWVLLIAAGEAPHDPQQIRRAP